MTGKMIPIEDGSITIPDDLRERYGSKMARQLWSLTDLTLLSSPYAISETERNLPPTDTRTRRAVSRKERQW